MLSKEKRMVNKESLEKWLSENSLTILVAILLVAVISAALVIGFYVAYFRGMAPAATWGQVGDFFGGTLNPIFGFLSVMALLAALVIQSRELKVSTEELRNSALALNAQNKAIAHQSFEQTFFSWLENYRSMLDSIEYVLPQSQGGRELPGRRALRKWWIDSLETSRVIDKCSRKNQEVKNNLNEGNSAEEALQKIEQASPGLFTEVAIESWKAVYRANEYQLDSLFRNLYRLILWIDSQHGNRMTQSQKWLYVSIIRAQLSWIEMVYLFYNGYTDRGEKFRSLVEKYALFDNLNFESDPVIAHLKNKAPNGNQYSDSAYDSRLARKALGLPESTEETLAMAVV